MITIVSVGTGNIQSIVNAFAYLEHPVEIANEPRALARADRIVLPGVGAFPTAMGNLIGTGFADILNERVLIAKRPVLGICLGMHLMAEESGEIERCAGFGWIGGKVVAIDPTEQNLRVPHVGWNDLTVVKDCPLLAGLDEDASGYFLHGFRLDAANRDDIGAVTDYGVPIAACVSRDNIFGAQFHPEKSQNTGLRILDNFARL